MILLTGTELVKTCLMSVREWSFEGQSEHYLAIRGQHKMISMFYQEHKG